MDIWQIRAFGQPLEAASAPDPEPSAGAVRLKLRAASLNHRDLMVADGRYDPGARLPIVPLSDAVWTVLDGPTAGSRAITTFAPGHPDGDPSRQVVRGALGCRTPGVACTLGTALPTDLVTVPDAIDDATAATLPCAALTAWSALHVGGPPRPGDHVLTWGTGGVACWTAALGRALSLRVTVATSDLGRGRILEGMGATAIPRDEAVGRAGPFDRVVDVAGGKALAAALPAVRNGGHIALVGVLDGHQSPLDLLPIVMRALHLHGIFVGSRRGLCDLVDFVAAHGCRVPITSFPWRALPEAYAALAGGGTVGKIVVTR